MLGHGSQVALIAICAYATGAIRVSAGVVYEKTLSGGARLTVEREELLVVPRGQDARDPSIKIADHNYRYHFILTGANASEGREVHTLTGADFGGREIANSLIRMLDAELTGDKLVVLYMQNGYACADIAGLGPAGANVSIPRVEQRLTREDDAFNTRVTEGTISGSLEGGDLTVTVVTRSALHRTPVRQQFRARKDADWDWYRWTPAGAAAPASQPTTKNSADGPAEPRRTISQPTTRPTSRPADREPR